MIEAGNTKDVHLQDSLPIRQLEQWIKEGRNAGGLSKNEQQRQQNQYRNHRDQPPQFALP